LIIEVMEGKELTSQPLGEHNMATLTYWYCECRDDDDAYSIISKTKTDALAQRQARGENRFEAPVKKTLHYKDAFDLLDWATGEAGGRGCGTTN
jgi:hypothetical protein